jgi:hypothetical protein
MPMLTQEFRHHDKLEAIRLSERNSSNNNQRKCITVQHFNDSGQPDSPAEIVLTQVGHSPVAISSINGGYFVAKENDPQAVLQTQGQGQQWTGQQPQPYQQPNQ